MTLQEHEDIANVDAAAVARVLAGLGRDFAHVDVMKDLRRLPKVAADDMLEIIMRGLVLTGTKENMDITDIASDLRDEQDDLDEVVANLDEHSWGLSTKPTVERCRPKLHI